MPHYKDRLAAVQWEIWAGGVTATPELETMLRELEAAPLPEGVSRLPTAQMRPGPHLEAQPEPVAGGDYVTLDAWRMTRSRPLVFSLARP